MPTNDVSVVRVRGASKQFHIRRDKSLKDRAVGLFRERPAAEEFWALRDIDLDIEAGATVGLVGHNGSGKSTLLKLIGGILQPTTGTVEHRGRIAALLELGAGFHPDLSGRENVYLNASILGLSRKQTDKYFDAIVDFSGIERFIDSQVKFYSSGMYVRLAFAVAVHVDPEILLVDEVLSVGDEPFQRKCMDRIHQFQTEGRTIILVSHSAEQVGELCHRAVVLDNGRIVFNGAAQEGIKVLRRGYEDARLEAEAAEAAAAAAVDRAPVHHATIESVELRDDANRRVREITSGESLDVVLNLTSPAPLTSWRAALTIETPLAQVVYGTNTHLAAVPVPTLLGTCQVRFHFPAMTLMTGQYSITAAIQELDGASIDWKGQAATFTVISPAAGVGIADLRPTIEAVATHARTPA
jgi:ABC-2 type transport system ATP-binding protein